MTDEQDCTGVPAVDGQLGLRCVAHCQGVEKVPANSRTVNPPTIWFSSGPPH